MEVQQVSYIILTAESKQSFLNGEGVSFIFHQVQWIDGTLLVR
jgi:hypothetical protein